MLVVCNRLFTSSKRYASLSVIVGGNVSERLTCLKFFNAGTNLYKFTYYKLNIIYQIWLESVEADMAEFENDREHVHDRKKWRKNVMKRKSNPIGKWTINQ